MISREEYIRLSLELNLFFARIAKEHSIFIEGAFTAKDADLAREADMLKTSSKCCWQRRSRCPTGS